MDYRSFTIVLMALCIEMEYFLHESLPEIYAWKEQACGAGAGTRYGLT
jgi:hypothetical protein